MGKDLKGKNLGKGFSQRKDGRYEARGVVNGVKIDIYDKSLTKLKKKSENAKAKLLCGQTYGAPKITLEEWYKRWFEVYKSPQLKSTVSRKIYDRKTRNTFIKLLGSKYMSDITQENIQVAANELSERGYQERTIREAIGVLRECFDIAIINKIVDFNPCVSIAVQEKHTQVKRRVLSKKEQDLFLNEVKDSYYYEPYAILLLTGMRIGEFSGLQWQDVDFEKKEIHISRSLSTGYYDGKKIEELTAPKTSCSYRDIPFFGETEGLFKSWKKKQDEIKKQLGDRWRANPEFGDLVFTSTVGSPMTRYVIVHDINKVVENINKREFYTACKEGREPVVFEHLHPHAFRHTFATRCFEKKMDPLFVQKIMGHADYNVTLSYTHVLDDVKEEETAKVGNFLD